MRGGHGGGRAGGDGDNRDKDSRDKGGGMVIGNKGYRDREGTGEDRDRADTNAGTRMPGSCQR